MVTTETETMGALQTERRNVTLELTVVELVSVLFYRSINRNRRKHTHIMESLREDSFIIFSTLSTGVAPSLREFTYCSPDIAVLINSCRL